MRVFLLITFIFFTELFFGQKFAERAPYEKRWALLHPLAALKVKRIYKQCTPIYKELKETKALDTYDNGGKLDAFRHVFFMAAFSQKVKIKKIRKLGIAHEKGNYLNFLKNVTEEGELADSLSGVMDLKNNELGFQIGRENKKADLIDLKNKVIAAIKKGEAVYFKRNTLGNYMTCDGNEINLKDYHGKWFIPKCLVPTNL